MLESFQPPPFGPPPWLTNPHAQTLLARSLRSRVEDRYRRRRIETPDGDFLDLDFDRGVEEFRTAPEGRVLLIHGLEGCSRSGYVLNTIRYLSRAGYGCVAMNMRSCSGEPNRLPRFYHSGDTGDLTTVLSHLEELGGNGPLRAVGFSLGGNQLLKYLGERRNDAKVQAALAVSVPFDLSAGADYLSQGFRRLYEKYFLYRLKRKILRKQRCRNHGLDLSDLHGLRTLRAFDDRYTAPLHGFVSSEDYYRRSSCTQYLEDIDVPTLVLQSRDDPFLPEDSLPEEEISDNPSLRGLFTDRGGHVGFLRRSSSLKPLFWAEETIVRFMKDLP